MSRGLALSAGISIVAVAVWRVSAQTDNTVVVAEVQPDASPDAGATPMAERIATIGFLNKRNGVSRDFDMKPGNNFRVADGVIIRLRACDATAPWEQDPYTGAFVQLDVENAEHKYQRIFSGWLYKESPSLNVVEHPIYDVWVKACKMSHGEPAPSAHKAGDGEDAAQSSKPKKSATPADAPEDTASDNNTQ